jgi:tripartite-type tricarboxylate transporter receptor subunit TctC
LPDVPTVAESGFPDFVVTSWYGICAPAKTPQPVLARLEDLFAQALAHPDVQRRVIEQGIEPELLRRAAFDKFFESEVARWSKVAQNAGIRPE